MNDSQFDELTRSLATSTSRRQALKALGATAVGAVLGLSGIETVFARCRPSGATCNLNITAQAQYGDLGYAEIKKHWQVCMPKTELEASSSKEAHCSHMGSRVSLFWPFLENLQRGGLS